MQSLIPHFPFSFLTSSLLWKRENNTFTLPTPTPQLLPPLNHGHGHGLVSLTLSYQTPTATLPLPSLRFKCTGATASSRSWFFPRSSCCRLYRSCLRLRSPLSAAQGKVIHAIPNREWMAVCNSILCWAWVRGVTDTETVRFSFV